MVSDGVTISHRHRVAAHSLGLDRVAAEVVAAMQAARLDPVLLKGASIAAWLYADGAARPYDDVDLLVDPSRLSAAEDALRGLGFRREQPGWHELAWSWKRGADAAVVDLHSSLVGAGAPTARVWEVLSGETEMQRVGGGPMRVLRRPGVALTVAMHAAQHGTAVSKPLRDLARAIELGDDRCWRQAESLAERIDAVPAFATGLRLDPAGTRLAARLGLPSTRPLDVALRERPQRPMVMGIEHLASTRGAGAKLRFAAHRAVPPPTYMRRISPLARRGPAGLALAYAWRPVGMLIALPGAIAARRRARAAEATERGDGRAGDPHEAELDERDQRQ